MDGTVTDADVMLNRVNVALARSQRLINSWLPQKPAEESEATVQDVDEDFKSQNDVGGMDSMAAYEYDGIADGTLQRKKLSTNDKLLEQLLGKKAARAKKSNDAGKGMASGKHVAPKPLTSRLKEQKIEVESEDEEEGGRAAAFKSRKRLKTVKQQPVKLGTDGEQVEGKSDEDVAEGGSVPGLVKDEGSTPAMDSEPDERPTKRKATSYLDEVLAQKAKKSKKKKRPKQDSVG